MAHFPGIPAVVTPADAEWLRDNHPRYEEYKGVIEARLAVWQEDNDPKFRKPKTAEDKKRHETLRLVAGGLAPASDLEPAEDGTGDIEVVPADIHTEPTSVIPTAEPPAEAPAEAKGEAKSNTSGGKK